MKLKLISLCCFCSISFFGLAQDNTNREEQPAIDSLRQEASAKELHDMLEKAVLTYLKDYKELKQVDSIWQQELMNSDLYAEMNQAIQEGESLENVPRQINRDTLIARLNRLNAKTPFKISYNTSLEKVINYYLKWRKESVQRLMSLSHYYFPLFEEKLDQYNIPLEMKYLAIVESALNPRAKSRVGATGLWQFMYPTGKMHGLEVTSYVDARMSPERSTEAAAQYLSTLYGMFNDWDLALAAYNSGPGNVAKAIRRSGGQTDYWKLRNYLPRETAGYVPSFIATMYLFEYASEHGFNSAKPQITYFETDTIQVKQALNFKMIEDITGVDQDLLEFLNPSFKLGVIPQIEGKQYHLRLPRKEAGLFVANEDLIYKYVAQKHKEANMPSKEELLEPVRYRVRSGDFLGKIAARYGVRVSQIKQWNNLRSNNLRIGQYLSIFPKNSYASRSKSNTTKHYIVRQGDSLWSISRKFPGVSVQEIQKWNDISGSRLKPGMKLKISNG